MADPMSAPQPLPPAPAPAALTKPMPPATRPPAPQPPRRRRGLWKAVGTLLGVLLVAVVALGAFLYATDAKVEATVQQTDCAAGTVSVQTKLLGLGHTVTDVPLQQCLLLKPGNFVEYRVRSAHTRLFDVEGGRCIYDSATGVC